MSYYIAEKSRAFESDIKSEFPKQLCVILLKWQMID